MSFVAPTFHATTLAVPSFHAVVAEQPPTTRVVSRYDSPEQHCPLHVCPEHDGARLFAETPDLDQDADYQRCAAIADETARNACINNWNQWKQQEKDDQKRIDRRDYVIIALMSVTALGGYWWLRNEQKKDEARASGRRPSTSLVATG